MNTYITTQQTNFGPPVLPIKRIELYSPAEWEEFIEEWLDLKKSIYHGIERYGGAGDKGRDVVAFGSAERTGEYAWDCYQCKHYDNALMPSQSYKEIGKILYYSFLKEYPSPQNYYFVAPKGCGTSLSKLLNNPVELKKSLKENWDNYCAQNITDTTKIRLEGDFLTFVEGFNFGIFKKVLPKTVIEEHKSHANHITRFGTGLPPRKVLTDADIPSSIQTHESIYVSQLLLAYESDCASSFTNTADLTDGSNYHKHFTRARINFHHAEQLRNFSRDNLPLGVFENYQSEILDGIINLLEDHYSSGFQKVKSIETQSGLIPITANPLKDVSFVKDRQGVCHQLCNDGKIKWT